MLVDHGRTVADVRHRAGCHGFNGGDVAQNDQKANIYDDARRNNHGLPADEQPMGLLRKRMVRPSSGWRHAQLLRKSMRATIITIGIIVATAARADALRDRVRAIQARVDQRTPNCQNEPCKH
jgi:hypothetical protein